MLRPQSVLPLTCLAAFWACAPKETCAPEQVPTVVADTPSPVAGYAVFGHSHNDYAHTHPLQDALDTNFHSVEADVFLVGNEVKVSHDGLSFKGTLRALYLDPLQARVDATGSVYGDGVPVTLWIELKQGSKELRAALRDVLDGYSMLTTFTDDAVTRGPVTVVLTGDAASKAAWVAEAPARKACRDGDNYSNDDPPADNRWLAYGLSWGSYSAWDGHGAIPEKERNRLACVTQGAHQKGRTVRFYATPETPEYWRTALEVGVDFINTDKLTELSSFLATYAP